MANKQKKKNPIPLIAAITVVCAALCAGSYYGRSYIQDYKDNALSRSVAAVEERNQAKIDQYNLEMSDYAARVAAQNSPANEAWPSPSGAGLEVVNLDNYPLENVNKVITTRQETMYNGMLLVNEWHSRPDDFSEDALVGVYSYSRTLGNTLGVKDNSVKLTPGTVEALVSAFADAKKQGYENFVIQGGYRTLEEQKKIFDTAMQKYEDRYSGDMLIEKTKRDANYPGTSSYNSGAMAWIILYKYNDKTVNDKVFFECDEGLWLLNNGWRYGLTFRFPLADYPVKGTADKSYKTGVSSKLQSFMYVGKGNAAVMQALGLCMEEYVEYLMDHPHIAVFEDGVLKYEIYREYVGEADTFEVSNVGNAAVKSRTTSLDNMDYVISVFEY